MKVMWPFKRAIKAAPPSAEMDPGLAEADPPLTLGEGWAGWATLRRDKTIR